ncbi:hypothetical protein HanIR_Chr17g0861751 [Helianthus annuus]|nr:hypothetical protein HanIR_Chr17g0861751 [Helianthus annuus]
MRSSNYIQLDKIYNKYNVFGSEYVYNNQTILDNLLYMNLTIKSFKNFHVTLVSK